MKKSFLYLFLFLHGLVTMAQESKKEKILQEMLFTTTEVRQEKIAELLKFYPNDSAGKHLAYKLIGAYGKKHGDLLLETCEPFGVLRLMAESKKVSNAAYKAALDSNYQVIVDGKFGEVFFLPIPFLAWSSEHGSRK